MFRVIPKHIKAFCGYCQCLTVFLNYITADSGNSFYKQLLGIRIIGSIETGDIIVFRHNERLFVKRVAAVGGDMIEHDGQLVTVPVDCFYVLGDNTEHSYDSRYWCVRL